MVRHDSGHPDHIESYEKDWIGLFGRNRKATYAGEEIRMDAPAECIDTTEREIDDDTYHIWTKKIPVFQVGDVKRVISEEDEDNPVKYLATNKVDAPTEHVIRSYGMRWRIEMFFEDSKQDLGLRDCEM